MGIIYEKFSNLGPDVIGSSNGNTKKVISQGKLNLPTDWLLFWPIYREEMLKGALSHVLI